MNFKAIAALSSLLALTAQVACTSPSKSNPTPGASSDTTKAGAPVKVDAKLGEDQARVSLRFDAPATDVQVSLSGVDGLEVKSAATPVSGGNFTQDALSEFDVSFTPGEGQSHLVVTVTGEFRGAHLSRVFSFAVGTPTAAQQKTEGTTVTGDDGQPIKVMPSSNAE
ncbi:hypothetical protein HV824_33470 [Myxococcus sp. AM009]|uniref:hypothetical protein n=1 Tax=unclassified Myxococcus TaxID=2648731 RepID=UPI001594FD71|nr:MULTISPECIES: hypothetical protein [unclassified Myxococcus]NVJ02997.1 hypothetical protein [Myxococcus sp. AM009]NVJ13627.1 hypothetical protein [Myxococcus sp. AM010]